MGVKIIKLTAQVGNAKLDKVIMMLSNGEVLTAVMSKKDTKKMFAAWDQEKQLEFDFVGGA